MAEYIEREALLKDIEETVVYSGRHRAENRVVERIKAAPAADVVKVTYCDNCQYSRPLNRKDPYERGFADGVVWCEARGEGMFITDYCSDGRRRDRWV